MWIQKWATEGLSQSEQGGVSRLVWLLSVTEEVSGVGEVRR